MTDFQIIDETMQKLYDIPCSDPDAPAKRSDSFSVLQKYADSLDNRVFTDFVNASSSLSQKDVESMMEQNPILFYYEKSFDKIVSELKTACPKNNETIFWHVYNMGYIVKTQSSCFSIDLSHRRGDELEPFLDFALVTHNHNDHYTLPFLKKMAAAGKNIYSNFYPSPGYSKLSENRIHNNGITLYSYESDHNSMLRKFMMPFEIILDNCILFTGGDSCNAEQLYHHAPCIDYFIVHPYVGLDTVTAAKKTLQPRVTLISHLMEFGHAIDKWRWSFQDGINAVRKLEDAGCTAWMPLCGEKIVHIR